MILPPLPLQETASRLIHFEYPEVKDLCEHFLTLVSAVLVASITFSEKIVNFQTASRFSQRLLITTWGLFITSISLTGLGLLCMYIAVGNAMVNYEGARRDAMIAYFGLITAGACFLIGMAFLVWTAVLALESGNRAQPR